MATGTRITANAVFVAGLGAALLLVTGPGVSAQTVDGRWLPWLGCWAPSEAIQEVDLLCLRPADQPGAVEAVRVSDGAVQSREVLFADSERHVTDREGCQGWEEGTFSRDQRRVFTRFEHVCEGGREQEGGAIMALSSPTEWLDVRVMGIEGERTAWVQRYALVDQETAEAAGFGDILTPEQAWAARSARMVAAASMDVDDVIEASAAVPPEAVAALVATRADPLDLNAAEVVRMADAGVPDDVIDVAVAVSFPDRFALAAAGPEQVEQERAYRGYRTFMSPFGFDPFYMPWSLRYGYGYGYGFGYGYPLGGWYGGYGYRPTVVVVDRADRDHGRVIRGRGYTRSRGSVGSGVTGGSYSPRGPGVSGSRGSAGSGSASGGSSSSGGRKAKPRGGH
jgi:hypothetical protein